MNACNGQLRSSRVFGVPSQMPNLTPARRGILPIFKGISRPYTRQYAKKRPVAASDADEDNEEGTFFKYHILAWLELKLHWASMVASLLHAALTLRPRLCIKPL